MNAAPLLSMNRVQIRFGTGRSESIAVHDVSLSIDRGEIVGLIGESGSGKSLTCRAIVRLTPYDGRIHSGEVLFLDRDVLSLPDDELRDLRAHKVGMVYQDPFTSLNPTLRVGEQLIETLQVNARLSRKDARARAIELLRQVEIPEPERRIRSYPHEMSGGMRQRVMIALAIASNPDLLIADEPTTALDVSTQAQVLDLLRRVRDDHGMAMLLVSHDVGVISSMCDRVIVMYGGFVVESGTAQQVFETPAHPYTRALLDAVPTMDTPTDGSRNVPIAGPPLGTTPYAGGCPFAPRCEFVREACLTLDMETIEVAPGQLTACSFEIPSNLLAAAGSE